MAAASRGDGQLLAKEVGKLAKGASAGGKKRKHAMVVMIAVSRRAKAITGRVSKTPPAIRPHWRRINTPENNGLPKADPVEITPKRMSS